MASYWFSGYDFEKAWTGVDWANYRGATAIDPYFVWAEATNYADLGIAPKPDMRVPVIMELAKETAEAFAKLVSGKDADWPWIQMSTLYRDTPDELKATTFCTAIVSRDFFRQVAEGELMDWVKRFDLGLPMKPLAGGRQGILTETGEQELQQLLQDIPGQPPHIAVNEAEGVRPVIIGVIDDGLAFAHERFQDRNRTTRIAYFWNQGYPKGQPLTVRITGVPAYGLELEKRHIDHLMLKSKRAGLVDEERVYRTTGYLEVARRWAHGTHVMDLACGLHPEELDDSAPPIICVQLQPPSRTTRDRSTGWLAIHVLDGLRYILDRAESLAPRRPIPVVVNLSFGHIAGPHDGSSMLEAAIEQLITARCSAERPFEVVLAAGNSLLARCHASLTVEPGKTEKMNWRVLPDDATPSFMELWLRPRGDDGSAKIEVEVTSPWGDSSGAVGGGEVHTWRPDGQKGDVLAAIIRVHRASTGNGEMILLAVAPTQRLGRNETVAPCGNWSVSVSNRGTTEVGVEAYIERDETPYGFPRRGRQSRFDDPNYERFDELGFPKEDDASVGRGTPTSYVKRADTINSIATGPNTVVVASFRGNNRRPARYSSNGLQINGAGVSEDSVSCHGVLAAGSRSGSRVAMNGTSVAAPQLARALAARLALPAVETAECGVGRKIVDKIASDAENPRPPRRNPRYGMGRADARPRPETVVRRIGHRRTK